MASETREAITAAWRAARREAERCGGLKINAAAAAGWLLEQAGGDVEAALRAGAIEWHRWSWWEKPCEYLSRVLAEELSARAKAVG